jgi:capsid protein
MLRGIAVGTGLSYEIVARDYSKTNYSSSRTSQLEDRRRFRRWQRYLLNHMCQPIWDAFCDAAAISGMEEFPTSAELLEDRRKYAPVEWQTPEWEWVDPQSEQASAEQSIKTFMSDYQTELGSRGRSYRAVFYQRAKEERLRKQLGLLTPEEMQIAATAPPAEQPAAVGTGEMAGLSRLQWKRNGKAIEDVLSGLVDGSITSTKASVLLSTLGLSQANIDALIADASDGTIETNLDEVDA